MEQELINRLLEQTDIGGAPFFVTPDMLLDKDLGLLEKLNQAPPEIARIIVFGLNE